MIKKVNTVAFFKARNFSFISFDEVVPLKYNKHIMHNPLAKVMAGKIWFWRLDFRSWGS